MRNSRCDRACYFFGAIAVLAVGTWAHFHTVGLFRNHGVDLAWALFGLWTFRAIWGHHQWAVVPLSFCALWECSEWFDPRRTFDPFDLLLYGLLYGLILLRTKAPKLFLKKSQ